MEGLREHLREVTGHTNLATRKKDTNTKGAIAFNEARDLKTLPVRVRPAEQNDAAMIYDSWLKAHAAQNKDQPAWSFYPLHKKIVRRLLKDSVTLLVCGSTPESQDDIYTWICGHRTREGQLILHYAFTKMLFRKRGMFKGLLKALEYSPGEPVYCSHRGWLMKELKGKYNFIHIPHLQFDWGLIEFIKAHDEAEKKKVGKRRR